MKLYFDKFGLCDGYVYYRCVISKLLLVGVILFMWFVNDYKVRGFVEVVMWLRFMVWGCKKFVCVYENFWCFVKFGN